MNLAILCHGFWLIVLLCLCCGAEDEQIDCGQRSADNESPDDQSCGRDQKGWFFIAFTKRTAKENLIFS